MTKANFSEAQLDVSPEVAESLEISEERVEDVIEETPEVISEETPVEEVIDVQVIEEEEAVTETINEEDSVIETPSDQQYSASSDNLEELAVVVTINIENPNGGELFNNKEVIVGYSLIGYENLVSCGINNNTNETELNSNNELNISLDEGQNIIKVECLDNESGVYESNEIGVFVDTESPIINLIKPLNNQTFNTTLIEFSYIPTDNLDEIISCNLFIDNSLKLSENVTSGNTSLNTLNLTSGVHNYRVECYDELNSIISETRNFVIEIPLSVKISADKTSINKGQDITFTATTTGEINFYLWNFGESYSTGNKVITHKFNNKGTYIINLTVTGLQGTIFKEIVSNNLVITVNETNDTVAPEVILLKPENKEVINRSYADLKFKAYDSSLMNCSLYLYGTDRNNPTAWVLEENFNNIENNSEQTYRLTSLDEKEYMWSVECEDLFGNNGNSNFNTRRNFTVNFIEDEEINEQQFISKQAEESINQDSDEIKKMTDEIDAAISRFNGLGENLRKAVLDLKLIDDLEKNRRDLEKIRSDLSNLKFRRDLSEQQINEERNRLMNSIEDFKKNIIINIELKTSNEFVKYKLNCDLKTVCSDYLKAKNIVFNGDEENSFFKINQEKQKEITTSTRASNIKLTYLSGDSKDLTLVSKELKYSDKNPVILEVIPKDIIDSSDKIKFLNDFSVVNKDPIIEVTPIENKFSYYIDGVIDLALIESTDTLIMANTNNITEEGGFITGLAIFNGLKIDFSEINYAILTAVLIIIILVFIYLKMVLGFEIRLPSKNPHIKKVNYIKSVIKQVDSLLEKKQIEGVDKKYEEIKLIYDGLDANAKIKVKNAIIDLCGRIDYVYLNQELDKISSLVNSDKKKAVESYDKIKNLYKRLPKNLQAITYQRCLEVINMLK